MVIVSWMAQLVMCKSAICEVADIFHCEAVSPATTATTTRGVKRKLSPDSAPGPAKMPAPAPAQPPASAPLFKPQQVLGHGHRQLKQETEDTAAEWSNIHVVSR